MADRGLSVDFFLLFILLTDELLDNLLHGEFRDNVWVEDRLDFIQDLDLLFTTRLIDLRLLIDFADFVGSVYSLMIFFRIIATRSISSLVL